MFVPLIDLKAQYRRIQHEIQTAISNVLEKQKFILDSEVSALEKEIAELAQTRFAISCASGTDALLFSLTALGVRPEDEVITTAFSFFSTAGMIAWAGATPVFVDIDPKTYNLDTEEVDRKISPRTKAIIAVHLFGQCSRVESLQKHSIPVIEDAAQAIGSARNGKPAGSLGKTGCFSFFPTKNLGAYGDGGIITTNDEEVASRLRELRSHGEGNQKYTHHSIGTNSRLDEIQAAILRVKLKYLDDWNRQRIAHAEFYYQNLRDLPIELPAIEPENRSNYHQFVIRTDSREAMQRFLLEHGVGTAIYYPTPLPFQPCFSYLGLSRGMFPNAEKCSETVLALPIFPELAGEQLEYVASTIRKFYR